MGQSGNTAEASEEEFPEHCPEVEADDAAATAWEAKVAFAMARSFLVSWSSSERLPIAAMVQLSNLANVANMVTSA